MAKDKISDYSSTANSNTDIAGINIDEGCAPSGINDAIRTLMAQLKTWQSGGQDVYIHPAGSASAPSITANGDTNTGIFFPAADTVGISTGGTERARVDSSGNLGLGVTPSAWGAGSTAFQLGNGGIWKSGSRSVDWMVNGYHNGTNYIYNTSNAATYYRQYDGQHQWYNAASGTAGNAITFTQAMTLDASGNLGIGTTSPGRRLNVAVAYSSGTIVPALKIATVGGYDSNSGTGIDFGQDQGTYSTWVTGRIASPRTGSNWGGSLTFLTNNDSSETALVERARIDSSGNLLVGTTSTSGLVTTSHNFVGKVASDYSIGFNSTFSTASQNYGIAVKYTAATPNNGSSEFFYCADSTGQRAKFVSNGGLYNYSANNSNLSDSREKINVSFAGDYLAKICAIPVRTYNYIDQNLEEDDGLTLGVFAQDVQAVAPELVTESNWAKEGDEPKMRLSIYQTDMQYALMKCVQEQQAIIETLTARITALEQA